jgi:hypothetical protein
MGETESAALPVNPAWSSRFMTLLGSSGRWRCLSLVLFSAVLHFSLPAAAGDATIDLDLYGRLLEKHTRAVTEVVGTRVDYRSLKESQDWKRLVSQVHSARPSQYTPDEKLAFWINAYNILTIDLINRHYPIDGIKQIGSFFSPVWEIEVATIEGRSISLAAIEHEILRKMDEPRIHGAIVCASISCPSLARTPYRSAHLDADLSAAMQRWLANPGKGISIDRRNRVVRLSKIFDWFEDDFDSGGGVLETIVPYLGSDDAAWIRVEGANVSIRYFSYDWSLNDLR